MIVNISLCRTNTYARSGSHIRLEAPIRTGKIQKQTNIGDCVYLCHLSVLDLSWVIGRVGVWLDGLGGQQVVQHLGQLLHL